MSPLALVAGAAHACAPIDLSTLRGALDRAEAAYVGLDADGFQAALDDAALDLPCLVDPLPPADVARWHGLFALQAFVRGDRAAVGRSLAGARAAVPGWTVPVTWVPPGHELRSLPPTADERGEPAPRPERGETWFDGHPVDERPSGRPTVFQWIEAGAAARSAYVLPGDPLPDYPRATPAPAPVPPPGPSPLPPPPARRSRLPSVVAFVGAAALGGASGLAFAGAASARRTFDGPLPGADLDDLHAWKRRVNGLEATGWACGGLAAGALTAGGLAWTR